MEDTGKHASPETWFLADASDDGFLETTLSNNATVILLTIYVLLLAIFLGFD